MIIARNIKKQNDLGFPCHRTSGMSEFEEIKNNSEEKLCPALLVSGQVRSLSPSLILRSRTALVRSPANLIQGLPDFDWCRGATSKPRRCIRSQPLQRARASECVAMWSGYSIG